MNTQKTQFTALTLGSWIETHFDTFGELREHALSNPLNQADLFYEEIPGGVPLRVWTWAEIANPELSWCNFQVRNLDSQKVIYFEEFEDLAEYVKDKGDHKKEHYLMVMYGQVVQAWSYGRIEAHNLGEEIIEV